MSTPDERRRSLALGHQAEAWVADELVGEGWSVVDRNWHGGGGELDLVVLRNGRLRFVEVRSRSGDRAVPVEETIDHRKQARLRGAARAWLVAHDVPHDEVAFLVALVDLDGQPWQATWIDDAF